MNHYIASILIILFELAFIVFVIYRFVSKTISISRKSLIWFIPVFIILLVINLYAIVMYTDNFTFYDCFNAITYTIKTFVFDINREALDPLFNDCNLFQIAHFIALALALITVLSSVIAITGIHFINFLWVRILLLRKRKKTILSSNFEYCLEYVKKESNKSNNIILLDPNDDELNSKRKTLFENRICFIIDTRTGAKIKKIAKNGNISFIYFNDKNPDSIYSVVDFFTPLNEKNEKLSLYLETENDYYEYFKEKYLDRYKIRISIFSRYELIASLFVNHYSVYKYLRSDDFLSNRAVKSELDINVIFLGFGRKNSTVFKYFLMNNQMVTIDQDNKLTNKLVNYYIIDEDKEVVNNYRIDYLLKRYQKRNVSLSNADKLCNLNTRNFNIDSSECFEYLDQIVSKKNSRNYFIISFNSSMQNLDYANLISRNYSDRSYLIIAYSHIPDETETVKTFGNQELLYSPDLITSDAALQSDYLAKENNTNDNSSITKLQKYYKKMSNRIKLNILGYDVKKKLKEEYEIVDSGEILAHLNFNKMEYNEYFLSTTTNVLAYYEKLRWNAFYILNYYTLADYNQIEIHEKPFNVSGVDHVKKTHICLTTYEDLDKLHYQILDKCLALNIEKKIEDIQFYERSYDSIEDVEYYFNSLKKEGYTLIRRKNK